MKILAAVKNSFNAHEVWVKTNDAEKQMHFAAKASGFGSSINGGELLTLALATCFCNDLYREAAKRNITITSVEVECTAVFGGEGEAGRNFTYKANVVSDADPSAIEELIN